MNKTVSNKTNIKIEAQSMLAAIVKSSDDAIISKNLDGIITSWNKSAEKMFGYKANEIIGKHITTIIPLELRKDEAMILGRIKKGRHIKHFETVRVKKDGTKFPISLTISPLRNKAGEIIGASKIARDISEQREITEKLEHINRVNKNILNSITDIFVAYDKEWNFTFINKQAEKMLGLKEKELLGKNVWEEFPKHKDTEFYTQFHRAMKTQKPIEFEFFGIHIQRWYKIRAYPSKEGLSVYYSDITDKKNSEEKIYYQANILKNISDAVIGTDLERRIITWNKGAEVMYGWREKDVMGKKAREILKTEFLPGQNEEWVQALEKKGHWQGEVFQYRKDGKRINVFASIAVVKDSKGTVIGGVGVNHDITERKKIEQMKDEFISVVSHELKTPLTSIKAFAQLLERKLLDEKDTKSTYFIQRMDSQLNKLVALVNDLLDVSKLEAGKLRFNPEKFDFDTLITETIDEIQATANKHTIQKKGVVKKTIIADRYRISQVITNFLTNAIKYSPNSPKVEVSSELKNHSVVLKVQDHGIGIPEDQKSLLFTRFYRVESVAKEFSGLGLGLYISREIIVRHGGRIWVESTKGKGSAFYFSLPLKQINNEV